MKPISENQNFSFRGGGTNFENAFKKLSEVYLLTENLF